MAKSKPWMKRFQDWINAPPKNITDAGAVLKSLKVTGDKKIPYSPKDLDRYLGELSATLPKWKSLHVAVYKSTNANLDVPPPPRVTPQVVWTQKQRQDMIAKARAYVTQYARTNLQIASMSQAVDLGALALTILFFRKRLEKSVKHNTKQMLGIFRYLGD